MDKEPNSQDSRKTRTIKAGINMAGIVGLGLSSCGSVKAIETATPVSTTSPTATETMESPPKYEVTLESVTGEKVVVEQMILYRVVDSEHPVSEEFVDSEIVPNLVTISDLPRRNEDEQVNILVAEDLANLINESKQDGINIYIRSGYRSFWEQQYALNKANGNTSEVALPGQSQHQTGLAIDFSTPENKQIIGLGSGFEDTEAGKWLAESAWKYGFVSPYINGHDDINPAAEKHHYLYVGREIAERYHTLKGQGWEGDIFDLQKIIEQEVGG